MGYRLYEGLDCEELTTRLRCSPFKVGTGVHYPVLVLRQRIVSNNSQRFPFFREGQGKSHRKGEYGSKGMCSYGVS